MEHKIKSHLDEIASFSTTKADELEQFRIKYLGKNGILNAFFEEFKAQPPQQKQVLGKLLNSLKQAASEKYTTLKNELDAKG